MVAKRGLYAGNAKAMADALSVEGLVVGFDGNQMVGREAAVAELGSIFADHEPGRYITKTRPTHRRRMEGFSLPDDSSNYMAGLS